ncbi:MAG: hypothetical protein P4L57_05400 [Rhizomicrobium sp.]|nr:hypothetical protein [Rhizomicrobium sp.]
MTIQGNSSEHVLPAQTEGSDDWLQLDHAPHGTIVAWSESHAGLILLAANLVLWGAVGCGVHFG